MNGSRFIVVCTMVHALRRVVVAESSSLFVIFMQQTRLLFCACCEKPQRRALKANAFIKI